MKTHWSPKILALGLCAVAVGIVSMGGGVTACKTTCAKSGGPTPGPADMHCGSTVQKVDPAVCHEMAMGGGGSASTSSSSSSSTAATSSTTASQSSSSTAASTTSASSTSGAGGGASTSPYGPTNYGTEADDDDCKYHVTWSATPICENTGVTFTVTVTSKTDGKPVTGAGTLIEAVLGDTHSAPSAGKTTESPPGTYTIGPVIFDQPGNWTVRYHIHEECTDVADSSQHGHAAFFITVP